MNVDSSLRWHDRQTCYWPLDVGQPVSHPCPQTAPQRAACPSESVEDAPYKDRHVMKPQPSRNLLWVDFVGGFLMCRGDQVTLGQAVPGTDIEVPIFGDLSRRHLILRRTGEQYLAEPVERVDVNGRQLSGIGLLHDGDELLLGGSVPLRFRQPHALSATARIDFLSHHGTQPSCDGVLLMAESCVLGPDPNHHIVCRLWKGQVILSCDEQGQFRFRAPESVQVDGEMCPETGKLRANSRLVGSDYALSLEEL